MDYMILLITIVPSTIYAVAGLIEAKKNGEPIRAVEFVKTIVIALVSSGLISQKTSDMVLELSATSAVTFAFDKLWNAVVRKGEA